MKNERPNLFSREWFESIQLDRASFQVGTSDTTPALEEVLSKHARVYPEGLGRMKNIQAWIHLEGGCWPTFWKACSIALAREPEKDEALRELKAEGVIKKAVTSEWAAPTVTSVKQDGSVRTCADN